MGKSQKQESQQKEILRLSSLAESGQAEAQNVLAARLAQGYGVKTDIAGALYWYAQAVALGYTHAKWNAGTMLLAGEGLPAPRRDVGMLMIDQAARSGEPSACRFLAQCFAEGRFGKEVDTELASSLSGFAREMRCEAARRRAQAMAPPCLSVAAQTPSRRAARRTVFWRSADSKVDRNPSKSIRE